VVVRPIRSPHAFDTTGMSPDATAAQVRDGLIANRYLL